MKVMIFIDNSNFFNSIRSLKENRGQDRYIDYYKINKFILNFLSKNPQYQRETLFHVRTYYYDGEYTDNLITKIKQHIQSVEDIPENQEEIHLLNQELEKNIKRIDSQKKQIQRLDGHYFFEARLKPLQYSRKNGVFQKGVDVQLAVDLVSNAYLNNYDLAILFSGDIDLYESIKMVKTLGKQVIIVSHSNLMARDMTKICDFYIDISKLKDEQLDEFTHIFEKNNS